MELSLIAYLSSLNPWVALVLGLLGAVVVVAQVVVALTPSKADDATWEKIKAMPVLGGILSALASLAPIQKK